MKNYTISSSILSANFAYLGQEVEAILAAGSDFIHIDVMDNHYVPNLTFGPIVVKALRKYGITAPIDVHLMTKPVERMIVDFAKVGADYISFHPEATEHIDYTIRLIHDSGCQAGLALNPATPLTILTHVLDKLQMVLLMSVNPGFSGQTFLPQTIEKLALTRAMIDKSARDIRLQVDGGINIRNIQQVAKAGADSFVSGSYIFGGDDYKSNVGALRTALAQI